MSDIQKDLEERIITTKGTELTVNEILADRKEQDDILFPEYVIPKEREALDLIRNTMVFCGTIGDYDNNKMPHPPYKVGNTYKILAKGKYAGIDCISGDLITAIKSRSYNDIFYNSDWAVLRSHKNTQRPGILNSNITETRDIIFGVDYEVDDSISYRDMILKQSAEMLANNITSSMGLSINDYSAADKDKLDNIFRDISLSNGNMMPTIIGSRQVIETEASHNRQVIIPLNYKPKKDTHADIMAALKLLAAEPSTDPYIENKLKKDDSVIEVVDVDIFSLRNTIKGDQQWLTY